MTDGLREDDLEVFVERTYRLILRLPDVSVEELENAVEEVADAELYEVDVSDLSVEATHKEFETADIQGGVSRDVDGDAVLTLQGFMYLDSAAEFLDGLHDLLRHEALETAAVELSEADLDESPLERVL
ncbi:MAG: ATP-binding protein [Halobacteriota archaeon]